jgi:hypothetical protein
MAIFGTNGQGIKQFLELGAAFLLSAAIGLEREVRLKSASLRTNTLGDQPTQVEHDLRMSRVWSIAKGNRTGALRRLMNA